MRLPSAELDSHDAWADWLEFHAAIEGEIRDVDVVDLLDENQIKDAQVPADPNADEEEDAHMSEAHLFVQEVWERLEERAETYGAGYPFEVGNEWLRRKKGDWKASLCYLFLLMLETPHVKEPVAMNQRIKSGGFSYDARKLFEKVVEAYFRSFGWKAFCFGAPGDPRLRGLKFNERVEIMVGELGLTQGKYIKGRQQDRGLDVAAMFGVPETDGSVAFVVQCATGRRTDAKEAQPQITRLKFIEERFEWVKTVAFSRTLDGYHAQWELHDGAFILDRRRLCQRDATPGLDKWSRAAIEDWLRRVGKKARIKFPA